MSSRAAPGLLAGRALVAVDLETTGWSFNDGHQAIEIACVTIDDGAVSATWSSLVRPRRPVPASAREVHGISDAMLAGAPEPAVVALRFRGIVGGLPLVFHNAAFDLAFLRPLLREAGAAPLDNVVVDTLGLARGLLGAGSNTLESLRESLGLEAELAHRALGDARTTARALLALAPRWERERGVRSLEALAAASQDALRVAGRRGAFESGADPVAAEPAVF